MAHVAGTVRAQNGRAHRCASFGVVLTRWQPTLPFRGDSPGVIADGFQSHAGFCGAPQSRCRQLERIIDKCPRRPRPSHQHASEIRTDLQRLKQRCRDSAHPRARPAPKLTIDGNCLVESFPSRAIAGVAVFRAQAVCHAPPAKLTDTTRSSWPTSRTRPGLGVDDTPAGLVLQPLHSLHLSLISDERIHKMLRLMGQAADATHAGARRGVCERTGSAAVRKDRSAVSEASMSQLRADATRRHPDEEQAQAARKEEVLTTSEIATKFRACRGVTDDPRKALRRHFPTPPRRHSRH